MIGQRIDANIKSKETVDLLTVLNLEKNIKMFAVILSLMFLIILILIAHLSSSKFMIIKLLDNFMQFKLDYTYPVSLIGLSLIFYHLFSMIFKIIISNQINTSKIVVDTSYIINSMDRLLEHDSMICWIKNDVEIRMAEQSPPYSAMKRLFDEKKYEIPVPDMDGELNERCLLSLKHASNYYENLYMYLIEWPFVDWTVIRFHK